MATDYAEKERAFIGSLADDTGASLDGWLDAITKSGLSERNDIIDWLRHQGFAFAKASWIERIHHNGGRLIYGDDVSPEPAHMGQPRLEPRLAPVMPFAGKPPERKAEQAPPAAAAMPLARPAQAPAPNLLALNDGDIAIVLFAAKGLRPLADVLVREIAGQVPGLAIKAEAPLLTFAAPKPFAALLPGPKELRLYADFTGATAAAKRTDTAARALVAFPHVLVLNDVRQIDAAFLALIAGTCARANN